MSTIGVLRAVAAGCFAIAGVLAVLGGKPMYAILAFLVALFLAWLTLRGGRFKRP